MHTALLRKHSYNIQPQKQPSNLRALGSQAQIDSPFFKTKSGITISSAKKGQLLDGVEVGEEEIFARVKSLLGKIMKREINLEFVLLEETSEQQDNGSTKNHSQISHQGQISESKEDIDSQQPPLQLKSKVSFEIDLQDSLDSQISLPSKISFDSSFSLSSKTIGILYDMPSPFIVIYSMCILMKHLTVCKRDLTQTNAGKLLLISTILAYKYSFDQPITQINLHFSEITGLSVGEINLLQMKYLVDMEFRIFVSRDLFVKVSDILYR